MSLRILIVEDDILTIALLQDVLRDAGHTIVGAAVDMNAALWAAAAGNFDVAIMDIGLERGTSGIQTARILREKHDIPSLFVSGSVSNEARANAAECRPLGFISKPFCGHDVIQALEAIS